MAGSTQRKRSRQLAGRKALENPLILVKILGHLSDSSDLLNCRLVNSSWNEFATETLLSRQSIEIPLVFSMEHRSYYKGSSNKRWFEGSQFEGSYQKHIDPIVKNLGLSKLTNLLSTSWKFPCTCFHLYAGDFDGPQLSRFLQVYGKKIQKLRLDLCANWEKLKPKVTVVRTLLLEKVPNLKFLDIRPFTMGRGDSIEYSIYRQIRSYFTFGDIFEEFEVEGDPPRKIILARLPNLEKVTVPLKSYCNFHSLNKSSCRSSKQAIQNCILSTKHLEFTGIKYDTNCDNCILALIATNQLDQVTCLGALNSTTLERLAEQDALNQVNFKKVSLDLNYIYGRTIPASDLPERNRTAKAYSKILNDPKTEMLTEFKISGPLGLLPGLDLFVYENVEKLTLSKEAYNSEANDWVAPLFPQNFNLSRTFPGLVRLTLFDYAPRDFCCKDCQSLPTVKNLEIFHRNPPNSEEEEYNEAAFSKLVFLFPNLTSLRMKAIRNFPEIAKYLWAFTKLQTLIIALDLKAPGNLNHGSNFDAAFTGFSMESCQRLQESKQFVHWTREKMKKKNSDGIKDIPVLKLPKWLEQLKVNPSICDLQELKRFELNSVNCIDEGLRGSYSLLSQLTFYLAFRRMQSLKVILDSMLECRIQTYC